MSVADERSALAPPPYRERRQALTAVLRDFLADPALSTQDLHDRCARLTFNESDVRLVVDRLKPEPSPRLIDTARQLINTGTDQGALALGLALLVGHADQRDIPIVKVHGLRRRMVLHATRVLLAVPGTEADLIWLAERSPDARGFIVTHRQYDPDPAVREWVRTTPQLHPKIIEVPQLRELLEASVVDDELWDEAGKQLFEMSSTYSFAKIREYWDPEIAFQRWADLADQRTATVRRAVLLLAVAEELATGHAAVAVGADRAAIVEQLRNVLLSWSDVLEHPAPGEERLAAWVLRQTESLGVPQSKFAVRVVPHAPDPVSSPVEARILVDGTPVVAAAWRSGYSPSPDWILDGRLRATSEPREIVLDENDNIELFVTIVREGAEVVWKDWHWRLYPELPGEIRFDADEYDRELARAVADRSWEWPARTVARLVNEQLALDPTLLGRWDCKYGHCHNSLQEHDVAELSLSTTTALFERRIVVGDRDPEVVADEVIATLRTTDPKSPISLYEHARRLHRRTPDGPLPDGGAPLPSNGERPEAPRKKRVAALKTVLRRFVDDPARTAQALHDELVRMAISPCDVHDLVREPSRRLLDAARHLVRHGTDLRPVLVGLGLLHGHADARDIPVIRMVGLLRPVDRIAARVLEQVPDAAHDLIWLVERTGPRTRWEAVRALVGHEDPVVRDWVRSTPRHELSSDTARQISEAHDLLRLLDSPNDVRWDQVGDLLLAMTCTRNYSYEIHNYADASAVYARWVALAGDRPATVDRAALLTSVAQDLATGPAAVVTAESRHSLIDQIKTVLAGWTEVLAEAARSADEVEARRAAWVLGETLGVPEGGFVVRVVVPDPLPVGFPQVEARIVVDGTPFVATYFTKGPAEEPEIVRHLRATSEPHEVRLAEAYCTEGCCGALRVTIERDGDEVVWRNTRTEQEFRFDAGEYDREIARAEQDHGWEWPARTAARLVAERLRADPEILGRWDCALDWCTAWLGEYDSVRLTFTHPVDAPFLEQKQAMRVVQVGDREPEVVADEIIATLSATDPRTTA